MTDTVNAIISEALEAEKRYGPYRSTHEAFGVLAEEVAELLDAIRSNSPAIVRAEAIQVAAVAMRLADQCDAMVGLDSEFSDRSGFTR
jgi:NTP pyrophosphatase (non-canonical NTP hydrolase)